jgi:hypothetical protein
MRVLILNLNLNLNLNLIRSMFQCGEVIKVGYPSFENCPSFRGAHITGAHMMHCDVNELFEGKGKAMQI